MRELKTGHFRRLTTVAASVAGGRGTPAGALILVLMLTLMLTLGAIAPGRAADGDRPTVPDAAPRLALVIGNSAYTALTKLKNPANDARAVAARLRQVGFEVVEAADRDLATLNADVEGFARRIEKQGRDTVSVVYYAGHGLEEDSVNYLVPVNAAIRKRGDVRAQALSVKQVAERLAAAHNLLNILIIDACRDNPFPDNAKRPSAMAGLVPMGAIYGVFIASSTASGKAALDGDDQNSPYTKALVEALASPGEKLEDVFKSVRRQVRLATREQQIPWESTSLELDFYFLPPRPAPSPSEQLLAAARDTASPALAELLLARFPDSPEATAATALLAELRPAEPQQAASRPQQPVAASVLDRARRTRTPEAFDLVASLFPDSPEAEAARTEAARLREAVILSSAGPTLDGKSLVQALQEQLQRLQCLRGDGSGAFDAATVLGLRQASLLTDDRFLWHRPTMAAVRALRRVDAEQGCATRKLAAAPDCVQINNESFCR